VSLSPRDTPRSVTLRCERSESRRVAVIERSRSFRGSARSSARAPQDDGPDARHRLCCLKARATPASLFLPRRGMERREAPGTCEAPRGRAGQTGWSAGRRIRMIFTRPKERGCRARIERSEMRAGLSGFRCAQSGLRRCVSTGTNGVCGPHDADHARNSCTDAQRECMGAGAETKLQKRDSRRHKSPIVNALLPLA
jgi:hypothetical protein